MLPVFQNTEIKTIEELVKEVDKEYKLKEVIFEIPEYVTKSMSSAYSQMNGLINQYGQKTVMDIYCILLRSSIRNSLICKNLTSALGMPLKCQRYHDFAISKEQMEVIIPSEANVPPTIMMEDRYINKRNILNSPYWFAQQVHYMVYAAMCGSETTFKFAYLNLKNESVLDSDELDYGVLYGGNPEIVHIMEQRDHIFLHFEGAVIGHQNDVLGWCVERYGYKIPFISEAMAARNYQAIFLSNIEWFMIDDDYCISDIIAGYILCLAKNRQDYVKNSLNTRCSKNCVNALLTTKFPKKELFKIFRRDIPMKDLNDIYEFLKNNVSNDGPH